MTTLFVSDLHCEAARPEIGMQFLGFLEGEARSADALYILGDLFESWVGDDDPNPHYAEIRRGLGALARYGVPVYFMHGNRDLLIGEDFAAETGVELLRDPLVVDLYGEPILISHGDAYCTDDTEYQAIRAMTRNPDWQAMMLAKPLEERLAIARQARTDSAARNTSLSEEIMDVNKAAIDAALREAGVTTMLHGHTHRPAAHDFELDGRPAKRIVLGDWYEQGSVVRWDDVGPRLCQLERA